MTYNSDQVTKKIIDSNHYGKPAQVGYDLSVRSIKKVIPINGTITLDENSKIINFFHEEVPVDNEGYFNLEPNCDYQITMDQGLETLAENEWATILSRSSLNRVNVYIRGVVFDPGYGISEDQGIGCALYIGNNPVRIHIHDRVAQFLISDCTPVSEDNLYNGRWQGTNNVQG